MIGVVIGIMVAMIMIRARQGWPDQLAIREIFVVYRMLYRSRFHRFFHSGVPLHTLRAETEY
jgi:hypothetical protein